MNFNVNTICKQYGILQCVHCPNVPELCFDICPDDSSFEPKHITEFLIFITIYIYIYCCGFNCNKLLYYCNAQRDASNQSFTFSRS